MLLLLSFLPTIPIPVSCMDVSLLLAFSYHNCANQAFLPFTFLAFFLPSPVSSQKFFSAGEWHFQFLSANGCYGVSSTFFFYISNLCVVLLTKTKHLLGWILPRTKGLNITRAASLPFIKYFLSTWQALMEHLNLQVYLSYYRFLSI